MAVPADTFLTYAAKGIRENLTDVIYNISPTDTPFVSNVGSGSSKGTRIEWQTDSLAAPGDTPVLEGDDATVIAVVPTIRLSNYAQINTKALSISGTDLAADNAGRGVEMAYQEAKKGLELRRDIEYRCVGGAAPANDAYNAGAAGTARRAANIRAYIGAVNAINNTVFVTGGADPTDGSGGAAARTDGTTPVAITETMLENVLQEIYLAGGNPDMLMTNTKNKKVISKTFTGSATQKNMDVPDKRVINAVDFYESDWGVLSIVPNRWMRQRDCYILDTDMWEVAYHRPFFTHDLAKTGDNEKKQMVVEWTLISKEQASGGAIYDVGV